MDGSWCCRECSITNVRATHRRCGGRFEPVSDVSCAGTVRQMMSGFGDSQNPRAESVRLMEEIVLEYMTALNAKVRFLDATLEARRASKHAQQQHVEFFLVY